MNERLHLPVLVIKEGRYPEGIIEDIAKKTGVQTRLERASKEVCGCPYHQGIRGHKMIRFNSEKLPNMVKTPRLDGVVHQELQLTGKH